jgi:hypothetical protein
MRHRRHDPIQDEPGGSLHILLVAGRAEPAAFARKGQQVLVLAMVATDAGKPAFQVAAIQELVDHFGDDGAEESVAGLMLLRIGLLELVVMAVGALPERRLFGIAGVISLHRAVV